MRVAPRLSSPVAGVRRSRQQLVGLHHRPRPLTHPQGWRWRDQKRCQPGRPRRRTRGTRVRPRRASRSESLSARVLGGTAQRRVRARAPRWHRPPPAPPMRSPGPRTARPPRLARHSRTAAAQPCQPRVPRAPPPVRQCTPARADTFPSHSRARVRNR